MTAPTTPSPNPPTTVVLVPSAEPPPVPAPVPQVKAGYLTSEAWINFVVGVGGLIPSTLGENAPLVIKVVGLIVAGIVAVTHTFARTSLKKTQITANIAGSVTAQPAA